MKHIRLFLLVVLVLTSCAAPVTMPEASPSISPSQKIPAPPTSTFAPVAASPSPTQRPVSPATSPLAINEDGVIYADSFMLSPVNQGGLAILLNLQPLIYEAGFENGWNDSTWYTSLEEQDSWVEEGALHFRGRLPGGETWYHQKIYPQGGDIHFALSLDDSGEADDIQWADFVFFLPLQTFENQRYQTDQGEGFYPAEKGEGSVIAEGFSELQLLPDDPTRNLTIRSAGGIGLYDEREWGGQSYMVAVKVPPGESIHFTLTPPPVDPGPNPPAVRYSHAGYLPQGIKQAILEIDWRDTYPNLSASLERKTPSGAETVLQGQFVPAMQDFWKQFAVFDFSTVAEPGEYRIVWAGGTTNWFPISQDIFKNRWQNTLDVFLPFQMSHAAVDLGNGLFHGASTLDDAVQAPPNTVGADGYISYESSGTPVQPGETIPVGIGGWFDAGDYDLNVSSQAFVVLQLSLAWEEFSPQRDLHSLDIANRRLNVNQPNGIPDLLEQIEWGARWLLAMQQSDGRVYVGVVESAEVYGATNLPENMTDGLPDTGDERLLYVDYHSDLNLAFAAALAAASRALRHSNPELAAQCLDAAILAWEYFRTHPEVYRATVYFHDGEEGREQMIAAAASELYLTQPDADYLNVLAQFQPYFADLPTEWPAPTGSGPVGFWYAPPFLARLYPQLPEGALKQSIHVALERAADALAERALPAPFPFQQDWPYTEWGTNGTYINGINDAYWLEKVVPERIRVSDLLPAAYWLYGLHPLNDFTFVFGSGLPEPQYHYHGILQVRFGNSPASVPGAVVPGIAAYTDSGVLYYLDQPGIYRNSEACIYDAASFLFAMLVLE